MYYILYEGLKIESNEPVYHSVLHYLPKNCTSRTIIIKLKESLTMFGVPEKLDSDNGPQFSSPEFRKFAIDWEFQHITSSPHYPQSNGFIERHVLRIKQILKKNKYIHQALLCLRMTPVNDKTPTPLRYLMNQTSQQNEHILKNRLELTSKQSEQLMRGRKTIPSKLKINKSGYTNQNVRCLEQSYSGTYTR